LPAVNAYFYGLMTEVIRTLQPGDDFKQTPFFTYFLLLLSFDIISQLLSVTPNALLRRHVSVLLRRLALEGLLQKKASTEHIQLPKNKIKKNRTYP